MKKKVLKYANNGNTVVRPYVDLTPYPGIEHIFTSLIKTEYGREYHALIFEFNGVFISDGITAADILFTDQAKTRILEVYPVYLSNISARNFVQSIHIELYKDLGMDAAPLVQRRAEIKAERERKEKEKRDAERRDAEEREQRYQERLTTAHAEIKAGNRIDKALFIDLCKRHGIPLHIRTIGMLNACNSCSIGTEGIRTSARKGTAENLNKVFDAVKQLANL